MILNKKTLKKNVGGLKYYRHTDIPSDEAGPRGAFAPKNQIEKLKTQKSLGFFKNIENFNHNSAKNDNFDDGRI